MMGDGASCSFSAARAAADPEPLAAAAGGLTGVDGVKYEDPLTLSVDFLLLLVVPSRRVVRDDDLLIPLAFAAAAEEDEVGRLPAAPALLAAGLRSREVTISSRKSSTD